MTARENLEKCGYKITEDNDSKLEYTNGGTYILFDKNDRTVFPCWVNVQILNYVYQQLIELGWLE